MELKLSIANYRCFSDDAPASFVLGPGMTAVVGANNAGKSALLRFFWELRPLFEALGGDPNALQKAIDGAMPFNSQVADQEQLFHDNSVGDLVIVAEREDVEQETGIVIDKFVISIPRGSASFKVEMYRRGHAVGAVDHWSDIYPVDGNNVRVADPVPMLDAVRALAQIRLLGPRRAASSQSTSFDYDGITGNNLVTRWRAMKGGNKSPRTAAKDVERQLARLFGLDGLAITVSENQQDLIVSYGDQSYQIDELGSGLGHFAVALITLGANLGTSWLLVDEPENGLHPTMQVEFLRTLERLCGHGLVFATHSYGLARTVSSNMYLVDRRAGERYSTLATPARIDSLAEFLGELGFSGYRDLGVDRLLLVEGPNDVRVVDELRRVMGLKSSALVLPLGGTDAINKRAEPQLAELIRICPSVFAMIDSEKDNEAAPVAAGRIAFQSSCKKLGIDCHVLALRSTENYLSERAVRAVLGTQARALGPFERAGGEVKGQQTKIAAQMTVDEIANTDLGRFLAAAFGQT